MSKLSEIQNEMVERTMARAFWDEHEQIGLTKESLGFGSIGKAVKGLFKAKPKPMSPIDVMAKKFMADPRALKSVRRPPRTAANIAQEARISEAHGARPGRKFAAMREEFTDVMENLVQKARQKQDKVEVEPGSIHLTKASFPLRQALSAARKGVSGLGRGLGPIAGAGKGAIRGVAPTAHQQALGRLGRTQKVQRVVGAAKTLAKPVTKTLEQVKKRGPGVAKTLTLGGSIAVGGTAMGASSILRRHAEQQTARGVPLHYYPS